MSYFYLVLKKVKLGLKYNIIYMLYIDDVINFPENTSFFVFLNEGSIGSSLTEWDFLLFWEGYFVEMVG